MMTIHTFGHLLQCCSGADVTGVAIALPKVYDDEDIRQIARAVGCDADTPDYDDIADALCKSAARLYN